MHDPKNNFGAQTDIHLTCALCDNAGHIEDCLFRQAEKDCAIADAGLADKHATMLLLIVQFCFRPRILRKALLTSTAWNLLLTVCAKQVCFNSLAVGFCLYCINYAS